MEVLPPLSAEGVFALRLFAILLFFWPATVILTAGIKIIRFPELRARHIILVVVAGALIAWLTVLEFFPSAIPGAAAQTNLDLLLGLLLGIWMTVDWLRSAWRTRFRPRATDALVVVVMALTVGAMWLGLQLA